MDSKSSGETCCLATTPWMMPLPSRKIGNSSLPLARRVVQPASDGDRLAFVLPDLADRTDDGRFGICRS